MRKKKIQYPDSKKDQLNHLRRASYHESGHHIIGEFLGLEGYVDISRAAPNIDPKTGLNLNTTWTGRAVYYQMRRKKPLSPYENAVIGWAGLVAERVCDVPLDKWAEELTNMEKEFYDDYYDSTDINPEFSKSDQEGISALSPKKLERALRRTCKLVALKRKHIADFAEALIRKYKPVIDGKEPDHVAFFPALKSRL